MTLKWSLRELVTTPIAYWPCSAARTSSTPGTARGAWRISAVYSSFRSFRSRSISSCPMPRSSSRCHAPQFCTRNSSTYCSGPRSTPDAASTCLFASKYRCSVSTSTPSLSQKTASITTPSTRTRGVNDSPHGGPGTRCGEDAELLLDPERRKPVPAVRLLAADDQHVAAACADRLHPLLRQAQREPRPLLRFFRHEHDVQLHARIAGQRAERRRLQQLFQLADRAIDDHRLGAEELAHSARDARAHRLVRRSVEEDVATGDQRGDVGTAGGG